MTVRPARRGELSSIAGQFPYPADDSPLLECAYVLVDDDDTALLGLSVVRCVQLYFYPGSTLPAAAKLHCTRLLAETIKKDLSAKGYNECDAYVAPQIERSFGRRLVRSFGAVKNWASYCFQF
jgi:hypothetical protein